MLRRLYVGRVVGLALIIALEFFAVTAAWAQTGTSLGGRTTDPQGAIVPGATVTITSKDTGVSRTATSDTSGFYSFPQLTPGKYSIKGEFSSLKPVLISEIDVLVNTPVTVDLKFTEVGGVTETITVEGLGTVSLNTIDATIGNAFSERQVQELPLEGRNVVGLLSLQPGVTFIGETNTAQPCYTPSGTAVTGAPAGCNSRNGSVNGGRSDQANVTLDGVDVNDQQNGYAFTSVLRVTQDSVQEFRVTTAGLNADQGRSSGAQIALVTRQGTNDLHGSVYEYHRNTLTTANDYFLKRSQLSQGLPNKQPKLLRNVFGAALGGPIIKDRLFIFGNYEGRRDAKDDVASRTVPSADLRNGVLKYKNTAGGITSLTPDDAKNIDPAHIGANVAAIAAFKQFPLPNDTSVGDGLNFIGYRFAASTPYKYNNYISRIDYHITRDARHQVYVRGSLQNDKGSGLPQYPGLPPNSVNLVNSKGMAASYKWLISPSVVNSLTYGFTRQGNELAGVSTLAATSFRSLSDLYGLTRSSGRIIPVHNLVDDFTWQKRSHTIQFGGNVRWIRNGSFNYGNSFPSATTNSSWLLGTGAGLRPADLSSTFRTAYQDAMMALLGIVSQGTVTYNYDRTGKALALGAPVLRNFGANEYEMYVQDGWKATSNLTVTIGVRYGLFSPPFETNGNQVVPTPSLGEWFGTRLSNMLKGIPSNAAPRVSVALGGPANGKKGYYDWDKNNFAPRVSFAWTPGGEGLLRKFSGGSGNLVIRGGFGVAYDRIGAGLANTFDQQGSIGLSTRLVNPSSSLTEITAPRFTGFYNIPSSVILPAPPAGFPQEAPSTFAITSSIDDAVRTPYHMLMNLSVQRQLPHGFTLEAAYVGRLARKLLLSDDLAMPINLIDPASNMDYFHAATALAQAAFANSPVSSIQKIPFWENIFPGLATSSLTATQGAFNKYKQYAPDFTSALYDIDVGCTPACSKFGKYAFFNDQFSALSAWRSRASSSFHGLQLLARKRFSGGTQFDFNYTFSKSMDLSSPTERTGSFSGFSVNAWDPGQRHAVSDFDTTHAMNANWIQELPFGRGKLLFNGANSVLDQIVGGWQVSGIYRWTSGFPISVGEGRFWPTNWNISGSATRIDKIPVTNGTRDTMNVAGTSRGPNMFADPKAALDAYRFTYPGGVGTRNDLRGDGVFDIDMGVTKSFRMPFEGQRVTFKWETFNLTNSVRFNVNDVTLDLGGGATNFGNYTSTLSSPRVMQFSLRYEF
jgi:hypothetical protein